MNKPHYEVVAALIEKNGKVFCCQRGPKGECSYKWEFPGGKVENGETKEEALIREIMEELACKISVAEFITTVNYEYNTFSITMHAFLCQLTENEPTLLEHKQYKWCDIKSLDELDFAKADLEIINVIKNKCW